MHSLLVPILAQLVTLGGGARTEVRDVQEVGKHRLEAYAGGGVGLGASIPYFSLAIGFSPYATFYHLESPHERDVELTSNASANAATGYSFVLRRTTFTFGLNGNYTISNPVSALTSPPPPAAPNFTPVDTGANKDVTAPNATTTGPTPGKNGTADNATAVANGLRPVDAVNQYWAVRGYLGIDERLSHRTTGNVIGSYNVNGGLGPYSEFVPLTQGPDVRLT
ncbi:MAG TPA: hypothetical protein VGQ57_20615, partial [Polyangiaceae bacterium]|nr:hypothetical protein [Polyangiaceae bacterium]